MTSCIHHATALEQRGRQVTKTVQVLGCWEVAGEKLAHPSSHKAGRHVPKPPQVRADNGVLLRVQYLTGEGRLLLNRPLLEPVLQGTLRHCVADPPGLWDER